MPTDLQEALTAVGSAALIQKQIDPVLIEYQRRYAPFVRALPTQKWGSNVYYFNHRDSPVPATPGPNVCPRLLHGMTNNHCSNP